MIFASLRYTDSEVVRKFTPEQWTRFCELYYPARSQKQEGFYDHAGPHRIGIEEAAALQTELNILLEIEAFDGTMITKMAQRKSWDRPSPGELMDGRVVQIAVPDLGLLVIDEVTHLDDACTDELQRHIDDGWRILAVCPPNAARRPDYILGRRKQT